MGAFHCRLLWSVTYAVSGADIDEKHWRCRGFRPHEILASVHSDSFYFSLLCVLFQCEEHIRMKVKPSDFAKFPNICGRTSTRFFISSECFEAPRCEGPNLDASTNEQRKRLIASDWQAMRLPQWLLFGFLWKSNSSSELNDSKRAYYHKGVHVSGAIDYLWIDRTVWVKHSTSVLKIKYRASMFFTYSSVIYFVLCFSLHLVHVVFHSFNNTIMESFSPFLFPTSSLWNCSLECSVKACQMTKCR